MSQINLQVKRDDFFTLVSQAYGLIEKRNIMPILSKVLISAKENELCIQATDQDNSLQSSVSAKVKNPGEAVVDAQNLYDILKELPEGDVDLSGQGGKKIKLKQGASVFHLMGLETESFPAFPPFQMKDKFSLKVEAVKNLIERTSYCSSTDETRYHLTGVFFETIEESCFKDKKKETGNFFRFTATDGHRLGLAESPAKEVSLPQGVILSKKGVQEVKKLISYGGEEVEVSVQPPRVLFCIGKTMLSIKLVEGKYPNYQPLIPKSFSVSIKTDVELFSRALRRVSVLSSDRFKGVNFHITEKKIQMTTESPEQGSAQDEVACERNKGEDLKARFNAGYILNALSSFESGEVFVELGGSEAPCVIRSAEKKDTLCKSLCVVMPMKM